MCTLTFFPLPNAGFILTSNRDETPMRISIPPKMYQEEEVEMCYPKDLLSGGTWIGISSNKHLACLLNGAFEPHIRKPSYRKSRGLVVKELLRATDPLYFFETVLLDEIEPFTMISINWKNELKCYQFIWDGTKKDLQEIPILPQIWSSPMLYSKEIIQQRIHYFQDFLEENNEKITVKKILEFQKEFRINRKLIKTTSVTQFIYKKRASEIIYYDLNENIIVRNKINF